MKRPRHNNWAPRERGLLEMSVVERLIGEHESGARDHNRQLWALLTLEEWHRQFIDGARLGRKAVD